MGKRRWLIRSAIAALVVLPVPSVLLYGCESSTQFDDLCGWTRDPNNCYREFFVDVGVTCGVPAPQTRAGEFISREMLDNCFLIGGGVVVFEPPLDLNVQPGMGTSDPETGEVTPSPLKVKIVNSDMSVCGEITFESKYDFSVFIQGEPLPENFDADADTLPEQFLEGGTFTMNTVPGVCAEDDTECEPFDTETLEVTCPGSVGIGREPPGPDFIFNRLQLTTCRDLEPIVPHVEIDFSPGGIEQAGVIRLNVFYPPQEGALEGAQPVPINYFECFIPAAPPACENGVKDGAETDIDCGGGFCTGRCIDGQGCVNNDDCLSDVCGLDMGFKKCSGP